MCCFNKVNLSAILLVHKRIINKDCTVKNNNEDHLPLGPFYIRSDHLRTRSIILAVSTHDRYENR